MLTVLCPHTAVEERGLFPAMASEFGEQMAMLSSDHRGIDDALTSIAAVEVAGDWRALADGVITKLFEHILKEQDGVFPAALAVLAPEDWERVHATRLTLQR